MICSKNNACICDEYNKVCVRNYKMYNMFSSTSCFGYVLS